MVGVNGVLYDIGVDLGLVVELWRGRNNRAGMSGEDLEGHIGKAGEDDDGG